MVSFAKAYFADLQARLQCLADDELPAIEEGARLLADAIANGRSIFGFGCTHSSLPIQIMVYRAGGLMLINPIYTPGLTAMDRDLQLSRQDYREGPRLRQSYS